MVFYGRRTVIINNKYKLLLEIFIIINIILINLAYFNQKNSKLSIMYKFVIVHLILYLSLSLNKISKNQLTI
jgi:hypothetical protein